MKQVSFTEKDFIALDLFYMAYPDVMREQGMKSLDDFIAKIAIYGMTLFQNNYSPSTPTTRKKILGERSDGMTTTTRGVEQ